MREFVVLGDVRGMVFGCFFLFWLRIGPRTLCILATTGLPNYIPTQNYIFKDLVICTKTIFYNISENGTKFYV
jgi:hypothetical protein